MHALKQVLIQQRLVSKLIEDVELNALRAEIRELRTIVTDFLNSIDDGVSTKQALQLTGIKSRATLIVARQRPNTLIAYSYQGCSVPYSRASCLAFRRASTPALKKQRSNGGGFVSELW